jgi:hypothetical protein
MISRDANSLFVGICPLGFTQGGFLFSYVFTVALVLYPSVELLGVAPKSYQFPHRLYLAVESNPAPLQFSCILPHFLAPVSC